jgi:RHS repeat-associated protein
VKNQKLVPNSYTYDSNGNMLTKTSGTNTTTYAWDFENRLTSVTLPNNGGAVSFRYDPFGRRIQKTWPNATNTSATTMNYIYDGSKMTAELSASGAVVASYAQGPGIDDPLAMRRGGNVVYYQADALGSITSLTSSSGATVATYVYDSFGNTTATEGIYNPFRYTGREQDQRTGIYYYRARYYDPNIGRFISEDPSGFRGGINRYAYVRNGPLNFTDPFGLASCKPDGWNRLAVGLGGLGKMALGGAKIGLGLGVTAESGGLAVGLGYYSAWSGGMNIIAGASQVYGAVTGNTPGGQQVSNYASSISTVTGTVTLVATGNANTGATVSDIEGVFMVGVTGGLAIPQTAADNAVSAIDNGPAAFGLITGNESGPAH